jgi:DNA-binding MarR family transcriptional regulator
MKFNFPEDKKTESVNISIYVGDINRVRTLAKKHNCTINDIYKTLINEALQDYEEQFGKIAPEEPKKNFSAIRDWTPIAETKEEIEEAVVDTSSDKTWGVDGTVKCLDCGTTEREHVGLGRCSLCYYRYKAKEEQERRDNTEFTDEELVVLKAVLPLPQDEGYLDGDEVRLEEILKRTGYRSHPIKKALVHLEYQGLVEKVSMWGDHRGKAYRITDAGRGVVEENLFREETALEVAVDEKEYQREYYQKNKERLVEKKRERRHRNGVSSKEKARKSEYMKEYWEKNKDKHHAPKASDGTTNSASTVNEDELIRLREETSTSTTALDSTHNKPVYTARQQMEQLTISEQVADEMHRFCDYRHCSRSSTPLAIAQMIEHQGKYYCSYYCQQSGVGKMMASEVEQADEEMDYDDQLDDGNTPRKRVQFIKPRQPEPSVVYCQNSGCKTKTITRVQGTKIYTVGGFIFCSNQCAQEFQNRNNAGVLYQ